MCARLVDICPAITLYREAIRLCRVKKPFDFFVNGGHFMIKRSCSEGFAGNRLVCWTGCRNGFDHVSPSLPIHNIEADPIVVQAPCFSCPSILVTLVGHKRLAATHQCRLNKCTGAGNSGRIALKQRTNAIWYLFARSYPTTLTAEV